MNFDPQKFFLGLMDFFSIILPGALLTYFLKDTVGPSLFKEYNGLAGTQAWMVFLFSSYLLGHFIFLVGSLLDIPYDTVRNASYGQQVRRLADGKKLARRLARFLAPRWLIDSKSDAAVDRAMKIKEFYLDPLEGSSAINAFQWSKAKLALEKSEAMASVQRFEADSKFFRSLFVVLCILFVVLCVQVLRGSNPPAIKFSYLLYLLGAFLPFLLLALWRYFDQRVKSTNQAYWYIITLEAAKNGGFRQASQSQVERPSHAGGVVFRRVNDKVEYLLVQAKKAPKEWVLPKGHIKLGERMQETAVREVREETGVWARIIEQLQEVPFPVDGQPIKTQFYLMEALEEGKPSDPGREVKWLMLDEAINEATFEQSKDLLRSAEKVRAEGPAKV
jgi:ADP-ribose pyrophosphatase YjhB (NUDIX family)